MPSFDDLLLPRVPLQTTAPKYFADAVTTAAAKAGVKVPVWIRQVLHKQLTELGYDIPFPTRKPRKVDMGTFSYDPQTLPQVAPELIPRPNECKFCNAVTWNKLFCNQCGLDGLTRKRPAGARVNTSHKWTRICGGTHEAPCSFICRKSAPQCDCCITKRPVPLALRCPKCRNQPVDTGDAAVNGRTHRTCENCGHEFKPSIYPIIAIASVER